jgi:hypothetical protein
MGNNNDDNEDDYLKSDQIFYDNVRWLLYSSIRIKDGPERGAMYGWKNLNPPSYPFIYNEITGYAITSFLYIYSELREPAALKAAKDSAEWLIKNMRSSESYLLSAGNIKVGNFNQKGDLSNQIYAFDNGMIMIGLLNLYKVTAKPDLLTISKHIAEALIARFFDGSKLSALSDRSYGHMINNNYRNSDNGSDSIASDSNIANKNHKWSTISGAYHSKLSLGLLELSKLTDNAFYSEISNSICNFAKELQKPDGRFVTGPDSEDIIYLHPHLYACEGLLYAGTVHSNEEYRTAGLNGLRWAMKQINSKTGGLPRHTGENSIEQSDCMSQLLRLLILCRSQIQYSIKDSSLIDNVIKGLHSRLLDFYISTKDDKGGMRYQLSLESACSWCTMFSMQALRLWKKRNEQKEDHSSSKTWLDFYI